MGGVIVCLRVGGVIDIHKSFTPAVVGSPPVHRWVGFTMRKAVLALLVLVMLASIGWLTWIRSLETPAYSVIQADDGFELRRYASYIVAETAVIGDFETAGSRAFPPLANYIFGDNQQDQRMAMTAPVMSQRQGEAWTYQFVMERRYDLEALPRPLDPSISIREVPAGLVAAHRLGGRWDSAAFAQAELKLLAAVQENGLVPVGEVTLARYDPPMTPFFLRRNELLVSVTESTFTIE